MDILPEQLEPFMDELEQLRSEMEEALARTFVTPYSDESTREEDYRRGLEYWQSRPFVELFRAYVEEVRRDERQVAWAAAQRELEALA